MKNNRATDMKGLRLAILRKGIGGALVIGSLAYLATAVVGWFSDARAVQANTTSTLTWIVGPENDAFYNFDFRGTTADPNNVDWPMRFLFRDNADIAKVKDKIDGCGANPTINPNACGSASDMNFAFNDQGYLAWDFDGGKKEANSCSVGANHMRLYANLWYVYPYDRNYNTVWGYYVFASVHLDFENGTGGSCPTYYSRESEEAWWVQRMLTALPGWTQQSNSYWWDNPDVAGHWDYVGGRYHFTQSNGYASYVWVP